MINNNFLKIAKTLLFLLSVCICAPIFVLCAKGAEEHNIPCKSSSKAYAIYLYNLEKDSILFEQNSDKKISPASTVKLMTAMTAYDNIKDLNKTVTITEQMIAETSGNMMKLKTGENIRIKDLFAGLVCAGYNDAAKALAVIACGSVQQFVEAMNAKAVAIGATDIKYVDPTGIDDSAQTTAYDTMLVAKAFMSNEFLFELSSSPTYEIPKTNVSDVRALYNRNAMISNHTGSKYLNSRAIGMNAGMTSGGGYCAVTSMKNDDMTYICVVMGGAYDEDSDTIYSYVVANELLNYVAKNLGYRVILKANEEINSLPVVGADIKTKEVAVTVKEDVKVYLPTDYLESDLFKVSIVYSKERIVAPVSKNDIVGKVIVRYNDEIISVNNIVVADEISRDNFMYAMEVIRGGLFGRGFIAGALCFIILLGGYIWINYENHSYKRRRKNINMYRY